MWYFDSWAVRDGLAFASERQPESFEANRTVFLSVPDLEPVPVGRISTAMRATRSGFQDGFRDLEGTELGLENLDQVKEVVRRGYLGGALGPGAATPPLGRPEGGDPLLQDFVEGPTEPRPEQGGSGLFEEFLDDERRRRLDPLIWRDYSQLSHPRDRRGLLEHLHRHGAAERLFPFVRVFAQAVFLESLQYSNQAQAARVDRRTLAEWMAVLSALGVWSEEFDARPDLKQGGLEWSWIWEHARRDRANWPSLLFRIPCPLRPTWDRRILLLSQKLMLPLVDRRYFEVNNQLPEFIPLLLCAMVVVLTPWTTPIRGPGEELDRHRLIGRAFRWIDAEMPQLELPETVEDMLTRYASSELGDQ